MKVELVAIGRVTPYPRNPRKHAAIPKVAASLKAFGFRQPIVVDSEMVVIAGHTRLDAARSLGMARVPVHIARELTPAQVQAYRIADNRTAEDADWDEHLLGLELADLKGLDFDLDALGFDHGEIAKLLADANATAALRGDPDAVPELPPEPVTRLGDLIILGRHRLLCADATDPKEVAKLLNGTRADAVFTDPPYAVYGSSTGVAADIMDDKMVRPFFRDVVRACGAVLRPFGHAYICCDWRSWASWWEVAKGTGIVPKNMIVWDKGGAGLGSNYANTYELLLFASHVPMRQNMTQKITGMRSVNASNIWRINRVGAAGSENGRVHNAQKPVALVTSALENSTDADALVVDFFGGSGTTLIAAESLGRSAALLEIAPAYCDVIVARWEKATGHTAERPARMRANAKSV